MVSNIHNLPEPLIIALSPERNRPLDKRISVTALIDAPLRRILLKRHFDDISEDASENLWALLGKAVHYVIEKGSDAAEEKIEVPCHGATLVGVIDWHKDGRVIDWKITSVWSIIFTEGKNYELQLQVYAYLLWLSGKPVNSLAVNAILRDWNKREAQKNPDYPVIPFVEIPFTPWPAEKIEAYVKERVELHLEAETFPGDIPEKFWCSPEERWTKPTKYAVKREGMERAVRVVDTEEAAIKIMASEEERKKGKYSIEVRPGEDTHCESYCNVEPWCPFRHPKNPDVGTK